ncbi:MAG: penicillin-binding protein activator LpoB [Cytophagales bacterium]|nr:penicillin-binding protein activator LpoB [Cytophagales bacterium]
MMQRFKFFYVSLLLLSLILGACGRKVSRISPDEVMDLSGRWNDTDARLVSETMIKDVLAHPWRSEFFEAKAKKPVVIVGIVSNKSHEHIDADVFIKDLEREFVNSGMVRLVQNSAFREKIREERTAQKDFTSPETQKKFGLELGADFMLFGTISTVVDSYKRKKLISYKVNLELSNLETNEKVWIGRKEIKKFIKR